MRPGDAKWRNPSLELLLTYKEPSSVEFGKTIIFTEENTWIITHKMEMILFRPQWVNTLRPRQNGRHFPDDIFKRIFLNENVWILINISLKFVPRGPINNIPTLFQVMAWRRPGDKPLSEPMMVRLPTHICVTRPQWVNISFIYHGWHMPWHTAKLYQEQQQLQISFGIIHCCIIKSMAQCKTAVSPLLTHWKYYSFALGRWNVLLVFISEKFGMYGSAWLSE